MIGIPNFGASAIAALCWLGGVGVARAADPGIVFTDITQASGIHYTGPTWGAAWRDYDGDGLLDVIISRHHSEPKRPRRTPLSLYRNLGDGRFEDASNRLPNALFRDLHGAAWGDFNADGKPDLLVAAGGNRGAIKSADHIQHAVKNLLLVQHSNGFDNRAATLGIEAPRQRGRRPAWIDVDLDGRLDIVFTQYQPDDADDIVYRRNGDGFSACPNALPEITSSRGQRAALEFRGFADDARYLAFAGDAAPGRLYRVGPRGQCRFELIEKHKHVHGAGDLVIADLDGDLAFDYFTPTSASSSFVASPGARWLTVAVMRPTTAANISFDTAGQPVAFSITPAEGEDGWTHPEDSRVYLGRDGRHPEGPSFDLDPQAAWIRGAPVTAADGDALRISVDPSTGRWQLQVRRIERQSLSIDMKAPAALTDVTHDLDPGEATWERIDAFYVQGHEGWQTPADDLGLATTPTSCAVAVAADFDNDMDLDLFLGCRDGRGSRENRLLENRNGRFVAITPPGPVPPTGLLDSVTSADFDGDGFVDLMLTYGGWPQREADHGPVQLLRNQGNANHWIELDLVGTRSARDPYGARVFMTAAGRTQVRMYTDGGHGAGANAARLHFGLGPNTAIEEVLVQWPDGTLEYFDGLGIDALATLTEGTGRAATRPALMTASSTIAADRDSRWLCLAPRTDPAIRIDWTFDDIDLEAHAVATQHRFVRTGPTGVKCTAVGADGSRSESTRSVRVDRGKP